MNEDKSTKLICLARKRPAFVHIGTNKKPLSTIENVESVIEAMGIICRYNVISKKIEITIPDEEYTPDNYQNSALARIRSEVSKNEMSTAHCYDYICQIADKNPFNPVISWVESAEWDGTSRLDDFYATVTATDENLKRILMRRWMISAVAAAYNPHGVSASGVLVFQGLENIGKTKWFKKLADDPAIEEYRQDGMMLDPSNRDSVLNCVRSWLVELGELDGTFRRADLAALKAFITRDRDVLRVAYAVRESEFPRRTVFFASVNGRQYLHDVTGNRRYWTIECTAINHEHEINMQQVWAEFAVLYKDKEPWHLQPDEYALLFETNKDYEATDPIKERVLDTYDWNAQYILGFEWRWVSATHILKECGFDRPNKADATRAGQIVRELNGNQAKRDGNHRYLAVPKVRI